MRRRECPGAAGIGSTTCKTKESCNTIIMIGKRLQDLAGCGALLFMVGLRSKIKDGLLSLPSQTEIMAQTHDHGKVLGDVLDSVRLLVLRSDVPCQVSVHGQ